MASLLSSSDTEVHQSEDLWLDDGNIVLRAENTVYRVHRSVLSLASSIFKDMFSVPQPPNNTTQAYNTIPLVHLQDTAFDTTHFVKALIYPGYAERESSKRFAVVAAFLRLGTKYNADYLREVALRRLLGACPATRHEFDHWDPVPHIADWWEFKNLSYAAVALAQECSAPVLLPSLMYGMLSDGSSGLAALDSTDPCVTEDGRVYHLDAEAKYTIVCGAWRLHDMRLRALRTVCDVTAACSQRCSTNARRAALILAEVKENDTAMCFFTKPGLDAFEEEFNLCGVCPSLASSAWTTYWDHAWAELPSCYNLPSWEDLKKTTQAAGHN